MIMDVVTDSDRVDRTPRAGRELMDVIAGIRRVVRRQVGRSMRSPESAPAQVELLLVVEREPGIGVAAAARALHLAGNSVSALVNQLAAAGLLRRDTDQHDRRAAQLFLTTKADHPAGPLARHPGRVHRGRALARLDPADQSRDRGRGASPRPAARRPARTG